MAVSQDKIEKVIHLLNEVIIYLKMNDDTKIRDFYNSFWKIITETYANLNINFSHFELNHLSLNIDMKVEYSLQCYPYFINDEIDSDALEFGLVGNQVTFYHQDMIDFLETFDDDIWNKLTRELRKEISFGTLNNS